MDEYKLIQELEQKLIQTETRLNRARLSELIDENFEEIGCSGKIYRKQDVIKSVFNADDAEYVLSDFEFRTLCKDCVLVKYRASSNGVNSLRCSIWINNDGCWQILHHQATEIYS